MAETEVSANVEVSVGGGLIPLTGKLALGVTRRFGERGFQVLDGAREEVGDEKFAGLLEGSEELEALVIRAITAAGAGGQASKLRLLSEVVKRAVLDDARIDEGLLVVRVLDQIDSPHIHCLEAIYRAERQAIEVGDLPDVARGAEKPLTQQVAEVVRRYPDPVLRVLQGLGLIEGHTSWDGHSLISGTTTFGEEILAQLHAVVTSEE